MCLNMYHLPKHQLGKHTDQSFPMILDYPVYPASIPATSSVLIVACKAWREASSYVTLDEYTTITQHCWLFKRKISQHT